MNIQYDNDIDFYEGIEELVSKGIEFVAYHNTLNIRIKR